MKISPILFCCVWSTISLSGQWAETLDNIGQRLYFSSTDGRYSAQLGGVVQIETYWQDQPGQHGWVFLRKGRDWLVSPRFTLTLDVHAGEYFYSFVKFRWDDGIHPGLAEAVPTYDRARFDEYFLRVKIWEEKLHLQVGRFAPQLGNFLGRHDAFDNPLITYPLLYEQVTTVSDLRVFPNRERFTRLHHSPDNPLLWNSVIWGPYYAQGAALFGAWKQWGYAFSYLNSAPSSRGVSWNNDYNHGTGIFRLTYALSAAWVFGFSAAKGAYFREDATTGPATFPPGRERHDYYQTLLGGDFRYEHRNLQIRGEIFANRFEVPNAGNADSISYYLEGKYKLNRHWFVAARWNHQIFLDLQGQRWDNDQERMEWGIGYKWNQYLQAKVQYSWLHQEAEFENGQNLLVFQIALKF